MSVNNVLTIYSIWKSQVARNHRIELTDRFYEKKSEYSLPGWIESPWNLSFIYFFVPSMHFELQMPRGFRSVSFSCRFEDVLINISTFKITATTTKIVTKETPKKWWKKTIYNRIQHSVGMMRLFFIQCAPTHTYRNRENRIFMAEP